MELVIALALISILALVSVPIAKSKIEKIDRYSYYLAYYAVQDIAANIVAQSKYEYDWDNYSEIPNTLDNVKNLCDKIKSDYNVSFANCDVTAAQMEARVSSSFKDVNPHIKLSNGLNIYITSDLSKINALSDAQNPQDRIGYILNVDANGNKKGKGILYQDVYPFYILVTGKILPLYNPAGFGGANNVENLAGNILYDDYSSGNRVVKASRTNVDFQTGACATRYIQSASYCKDIAIDAHCTSTSDCRYVINKPMKFFGR